MVDFGLLFGQNKSFEDDVIWESESLSQTFFFLYFLTVYKQNNSLDDQEKMGRFI